MNTRHLILKMLCIALMNLFNGSSANSYRQNVPKLLNFRC